jgi:zinc protease
MSKKKTLNAIPSSHFIEVAKSGDITEYQLKENGLRVLYKHIPDTGVVTTNITYLVGARDEAPGETGIAHMLEHMLFKPTEIDKVNKQEASCTVFEREVGPLMNANTWRDRTTYYFSYNREHFERAVKIEAERMREVLLDDKEFLPERTNVLSEFDMYNGDPNFALSVGLYCTAFYSHPYGHETIGFREDIEAYTKEKLQRFYDHFYRPNNAVLMVIGDIDLKTTLDTVYQEFSHLEAEPGVEERPVIIEPKQEGIRRFDIKRPGTVSILAIAAKHPGFPSKEWFTTMMALKVLSGSPTSVLIQKFVDTGIVSAINISHEPSKDANLAVLSFILGDKTDHGKLETDVLRAIDEISESDIKKQYKSIIAKTLTSELFNRDSSADIAAELTEYVSAGDWTKYSSTKEILTSITVKDIKNEIKRLYQNNNLTIGTYRSYSV